MGSAIRARHARVEPVPRPPHTRGARCLEASMAVRAAHVARSLEAFVASAKSGGPSLAYVAPATDVDVLQLPLRFRFHCGTEECAGPHDFRCSTGSCTRWRGSRGAGRPQVGDLVPGALGAGLHQRFDVRVLLSTYAQSPGSATSPACSPRRERWRIRTCICTHAPTARTKRRPSRRS